MKAVRQLFRRRPPVSVTPEHLPLPEHILRHFAAQDAGQFTPFPGYQGRRSTTEKSNTLKP